MGSVAVTFAAPSSVLNWQPFHQEARRAERTSTNG